MDEIYLLLGGMEMQILQQLPQSRHDAVGQFPKQTSQRWLLVCRLSQYHQHPRVFLSPDHCGYILDHRRHRCQADDRLKSCELAIDCQACHTFQERETGRKIIAQMALAHVCSLGNPRLSEAGEAMLA